MEVEYKGGAASNKGLEDFSEYRLVRREVKVGVDMDDVVVCAKEAMEHNSEGVDVPDDFGGAEALDVNAINYASKRGFPLHLSGEHLHIVPQPDQSARQIAAIALSPSILFA